MKQFFISLFSILLLCTACKRGGDGVPEFESDFVETDDPNGFLEFLNPQVGLPAGQYLIVAATESSGQSGSFTITVEYNNGQKQEFSGSWSNSGGQDESSVDNPRYTISQEKSGGINIDINTSVSACLYLLDRNDNVLAGQSGTNLCTNTASIEMPRSKINVESNAIAYYQAIDPDNTRDTLAKWKAANRFGEACGTIDPCEVHVIFRDTKDLGYGRNMFARRNDDGSVAIFVENFQVDAVPGSGSYSALNLEAAIKDQRQWHFGSNAIEFSAYPYGTGDPNETPGAPMFAKFFTFRPENRVDPDTTENRLNMINLDGRGDKSMPGPCILCHGGTSRPLLSSTNEYPPFIPGGVAGDVEAQLQILEIDTFGFSDIDGYSRAELEDKLRFINQAILSTYETAATQNRAGHMNADFLRELLIGRYGGDPTAPMPYTLPSNRYNGEDTKDDDYIPLGWRPNPNTGSPPAGADELFREVIGPHCSVCHARRGNELGTNTNSNLDGKDINFSSYEKFISHTDQLESFIYDRGIMPLSLLNFDDFWRSEAPHKPSLLGSFLPNFNNGNTSGNVEEPGLPVAIPAAPSSSNVPMTISAEGSYFASSYSWSISNTPSGCSDLSIDDSTLIRPTLSGGQNGCTYEISLVVSDSDGTQSPAVTTDITIDTTLKAPRSLQFAIDILPVFSGPADCASCHSAGGGSSVAGVPAYWTSTQVENRDLYEEVLQRVNFPNPLDSKLIRKPSGNHHYGNVRTGFDLSNGGDRSNYDLFLSWILEGGVQ